MLWNLKTRKCAVCGQTAELTPHPQQWPDGAPLTAWNRLAGDNEARCLSCGLSNPEDLYPCCASIVLGILNR
jgi:hypothetical protein